jgi:hypothetical protein
MALMFILCQYDPWATLAACTDEVLALNICWSMFFEASFLLLDNELHLERMKLDMEK